MTTSNVFQFIENENKPVIQLIGCFDEGGMVAHVPDPCAMYWGVYLEAPETDCFEVVADFYVKDAAYDYVNFMVESHGYTLDDKTIQLNKQAGAKDDGQ